MIRWLDSPAVIKLFTQRAISTQASELGAMTVSMVKGEEGTHRRAGEELAEFLAALKPDIVCFSNALLSGVLRTIRHVYRGPVVCVLQGDDIFLDGLVAPHRDQVMSLLRERAAEFDGFVTHSDYYREYMSGYLCLPIERFVQLPLAIDCSLHNGLPKPERGSPPTIGYFARICPEKGLDRLVEAVLLLRRRIPDIRLHAGGYLGVQHRSYLQSVVQKAAALGDNFRYIGSPAEKHEKIEFLKSIDVFSVPTVYHEPKGIYVLEAWANGLPVVLPRHGAFPQLIDSAGGGLLFDPQSPQGLADTLERVLLDDALRLDLAKTGHERVRAQHGLESLARHSGRVLGSFLPSEVAKAL